VVETNHHAALLFRPKFATFSYTRHSEAFRLRILAVNVKKRDFKP